MQPVNYSKFCYYKIEEDDLDSLEPQPVEFLGGGLQRMVGVGIDEPCCQLVYEDFFPGYEYRWTTWVDQLDFVTQGKAEITYYQPPSLEEADAAFAARFLEAPAWSRDRHPLAELGSR